MLRRKSQSFFTKSFVVTSYPNLVRENTWTYSFGSQKDDAQAKAIETNIARLGSMTVITRL